jgi:hypothetical protein
MSTSRLTTGRQIAFDLGGDVDFVLLLAAAEWHVVDLQQRCKVSPGRFEFR